ncbi:MAG: hypothetical protein WA631_01610, partial [Nitrososphaeraceae archaeon]
MVDLLLAAALDNQIKDDNDRIVRRRNKVISTKVSIDLHNRFNLLADYLFERGYRSMTGSCSLLVFS